MNKDLTIGVLGLQGAFAKHIAMLEKLNVETIQVRYPEELDRCDGLIFPGGESTTMSKLIDEMHIRDQLAKFDRPIFGTCAGAILMSSDSGDSRVPTFNKVPIKAHRNAWGRQLESFISEIDLSFDTDPFKAVFIRSPKLSEPGKNVKVLGKLKDEIVLVQYENLLLSTFHPELTDDTRIHEYFIKLVKK
ncbi:pyridoxal 5'-phosphate synthase glutaminase subunit PdxT [bacterium]|nr:pyridoxal 5'-phosphate synthase glutaminase subunit PdxT [bacterium]MBU1064253.1 pyridoxal 5'-phosphate synthase glutaminase subunit PdxT [bacterium]MBU1635318.1 pyridoxal 5'-phosphate synthase glutaminase subunit PdxT [bacterium]MBU1874023.1 pyridoxal 5'-phosphate synthase glutaminase subunit PdxT [bacterium]